MTFHQALDVWAFGKRLIRIHSRIVLHSHCQMLKEINKAPCVIIFKEYFFYWIADSRRAGLFKDLYISLPKTDHLPSVYSIQR